MQTEKTAAVSHLSLAAINEPSKSQQINSLQVQIKALARANIHAMLEQMTELTKLSAEIADGGEAYHPGVRELARVINQKMEADGLTIQALIQR